LYSISLIKILTPGLGIVFLITARSRRQFIADFTVEQFGFETCMWFMGKDEYVRTCMLDEAVVQPMEEELERARRGFLSPKLGLGWVVTVVVTVVVMKEEFRLWGRLDRKSRMMYLERVVKEVSERSMEIRCCRRRIVVWRLVERWVLRGVQYRRVNCH
jgi:hypothetical protein